MHSTISRSRPSSPVHLFVDKNTPVHVYKEKGDNFNSESKTVRNVKVNKLRRPRKPGSNVPTSKLMRSKPQRVRSVSPPWVPPPGKSTKNSKSPFWNDEEAQLSQQGHYEQQITDLLNEVSELKEQLKMEKQCEQIIENENTMQSREEMLEELKMKMDAVEKENYYLRDSLDKTRSNMDLNPETEKLIQMLIETELAGERCAHQMQHVFDYLKCFIKEGHKITSRDVDRINTLFHETEARLFEYKSFSNRLREMLKESQQNELNDQNVREKENNLLFKKRKELEDDISKLELDLSDKDRVIEDLRKQLTIKKDEAINFASTHESLENVKGHLQQQLKQKSGDCNRMSVQIRTLENELAKERLDKEHLMEILKNPKNRHVETYDDRDVLKKAARAQKQRALKAEEAIQELTSLLADKERHIEELMCNQIDNSTNYNEKLFNKPYTDLTVQCEVNSQEDQEHLRHMDEVVAENKHLHRCLVNEEQDNIVMALKRENDTLRSIADQCENRLRDVEREMRCLRKAMTEDNEDQNEDHVARLSKLLEKLETAEKCNQNSQMRIEDLERKIKNLENQNFEMKNTVQQKDTSVIDNRCKVDDLVRENASLMRQLEAALTDSRRNADNAREKSAGKDRQLQSHVHDIESQLAQQRADSNKWRRACEETERKCNSKMQDMKIQLEQSEITNRSMQTYVQFLKKSYANVFGDIPLTNGLSGPNVAYMGPSLSFSGF